MSILGNLRWTDAVDMLLVSVVLYYSILLIRETKAIQLLKGILVLFVITFLSQLLHLTVLNWLLERVFALGIVAVVILFQPELRRALRKLGTDQILPFPSIRRTDVGEILEAVRLLAESRIGSIIALARTTPLGSYAESGSRIDAAVERRLLMSLFYPGSPLHDGAVLVERDRILAAGCILPVQAQPDAGHLGTRHLAGLRLSEETDALVLVTSEETGKISLALEGRLYEGIGIQDARQRIESMFHAR